MMETDHRVGQVLAALDENGLTPNTLVFLSSDNGAETGYAPRLTQYQHASSGEFKGGKRDIYEGGHRVPFIMRWPAVIISIDACIIGEEGLIWKVGSMPAFTRRIESTMNWLMACSNGPWAVFSFQNAIMRSHTGRSPFM